MLCQTKIGSVIMTRRDGSIRAYRPSRTFLSMARNDFGFLFFPISSPWAQGLGPGPWPRARAQGLGPGPGPKCLGDARNANNFRNRPRPRPSCAGAEIRRSGKPLTWIQKPSKNKAQNNSETMAKATLARQFALRRCKWLQ